MHIGVLLQKRETNTRTNPSARFCSIRKVQRQRELPTLYQTPRRAQRSLVGDLHDRLCEWRTFCCPQLRFRRNAQLRIASRPYGCTPIDLTMVSLNLIPRFTFTELSKTCLTLCPHDVHVASMQRLGREPTALAAGERSLGRA